MCNSYSNDSRVSVNHDFFSVLDYRAMDKASTEQVPLPTGTTEDVGSAQPSNVDTSVAQS